MATILIEDNQSLNNKPFIIPDNIMKHLKTTLSMYGKYKDNDGYKRLNSLVDTEYNKRTDKQEAPNQISYGNLKRIKHDFETIGNNPKDIRYILNGGEKMYNWVNTELRNKRTAVQPVNAVKKSDNIKKSSLKPSSVNNKQIKLQKIGNSSINIHENKSNKKVYLTENQLILLKEHRNELYLPFNGGNGLNDKPCINHFIDWIEEYSKYGKLPSAIGQNAYKMYKSSIMPAMEYTFEYNDDNFSDYNYDFIMHYEPNKNKAIYTDYFYEYLKENNIDLNNCHEIADYICYNLDLIEDNCLTEQGKETYENYKFIYFNDKLNDSYEGNYFDNINFDDERNLIYIYRMISIPDFNVTKNGEILQQQTDDDYFEYLQKKYGNGIGPYWSYDISGCDTYCGYQISNNDVKIILKGLVQPKSIDWARSTGIKIQFSEEKEITVLQDEPIEIYDIIYYDNKGKEKHIPLKQSIIMQA